MFLLLFSQKIWNDIKSTTCSQYYNCDEFELQLHVHTHVIEFNQKAIILLLEMTLSPLSLHFITLILVSRKCTACKACKKKERLNSSYCCGIAWKGLAEN